MHVKITEVYRRSWWYWLLNKVGFTVPPFKTIPISILLIHDESPILTVPENKFGLIGIVDKQSGTIRVSSTNPRIVGYNVEAAATAFSNRR